MTHVQSLNQEVGSGDEGLGFFGFDFSSTETGVWWLEEEQLEEGKSILVHDIDLGTAAAEVGGSECCSRSA